MILLPDYFVQIKIGGDASKYTHQQEAQARLIQEEKLSINNCLVQSYAASGVWQPSWFQHTSSACKTPSSLSCLRLSKWESGNCYCLLISSVDTSPLQRNFNRHLYQILSFLFHSLKLYSINSHRLKKKHSLSPSWKYIWRLVEWLELMHAFTV